MTTSTLHRLLTVQEAADLLRTSTSTILRWIDEGELPAFRTGPAPDHYLIYRRDVEQMHLPRSERVPAISEDPEAQLPPPLTEEQRQRVFAVLARLRAMRAKLLEERGGVPFPDTVELIREMREERDRELGLE
jgi:excisionase family DNA binding protein